MPLCFGSSGSVRTKHMHQSAWCAPDVHTFWPLTTKWSPSRTARVRRLARSLPAVGSLMPRHHAISARSVGRRNFSICSGVPWSLMDGAMMPRPCGLRLRGISRADISSK